MAGIGPATSPLPRECSATEPHGPTQIGAGEGNRTLVVSLENFCSTIELHPHLAAYPAPGQQLGGGGRIRTFEGRAVRFTV